VVTAEDAAEALERERSLSLSPMLMRDMDKAVDRIQRALNQGETIAVFGDYDVDGITSTVLLMDYLRRCGARCLRYIPRRVEDGYGLSRDAIQSLRDQGATLMITVDCGITGNEEVAFAASLGMDVVVTDHHECKSELPAAAAVVDPHRPDCPYPFKHLAGVGVALKLVLALGGRSREEALFARYCTLAAIGTVAAVMRMEGEPRPLVSGGLEALPHRTLWASTPCCGRRVWPVSPSPPSRSASCSRPGSTPPAAWERRTWPPTCWRPTTPPGRRPWPGSCAS
jgi:single-stranded-DNA-specific exonuclease